MTWKNRIVEQRMVPVAELKANPHNWRLHPASQQAALGEIFDRVGVVQGVIYNERTGRLVDGHLRLEMAQNAGHDEIPVTVVDLSEDEEKLVLATLDPIGTMAQVNEKVLREVAAASMPDEGSLAALVDSVLAPFNAPDDPQQEWDASGMPDFENKDSTFRQVQVHFEDQAGVDRFIEVTGVKLTPKAKYVWFK